MLNINSSYSNFQTQPSIGFKGLSDGNKSQVTTGADEKFQTKLSTKGKVILGTTLTGLAALGIYLATRGKAKPSTIHTPSEPIPNPTEILENSLDKFRELGGKLVKGKAIDKDGNLFTGTLVKETPSGATVTLKYENGVLKESKATSEKTVTSSKTYTYDANGKISTVTNNNEKVAEFKHDEATGKLIEHKDFDGVTQKFYYDSSGSLKYMDGYKLKPNGINDGRYGGDCDRKARAFVEFDTVTKKPIKGVAVNREKTVIIDFDNKGEVSRLARGKFSINHSDFPNGIRYSVVDKNGSFGFDLNYLTEGRLPNYARKLELHTKNGDYFAEFSEWVPKGKSRGKHSGYSINYMPYSNGPDYKLFGGENGVFRFNIEGKEIGTYNAKTGKIEIIPNSGKTEIEVKPMIDDLLNAHKIMLEHYKNTYKYGKDEFRQIVENAKHGKL